MRQSLSLTLLSLAALYTTAKARSERPRYTFAECTVVGNPAYTNGPDW